ncbi:hypothetical protein N2152v2_004041 [Parachlorella kessleri]
MGRKRKDLVPPVEPGNVLEGVVLNQQTPDTWAVQFRFNGKSCSKLLYGTKQTAAAVRELVAIWLCYKASDAAAVAIELQQLQHSYEHYSFLIEALKHSRSVEALWKIVGKFCRGEFEIRSAARMAAGPSGGEGDVSSQGVGVGLGGADACEAQLSGLTNDAGTSSQGAPPADGQCLQLGDGALSSAAGLHNQHYQQEQEGLTEGAALDAAAAAAAAAAAGMVADPAAAAAAMAAAAAAGFSANAAAALQAAFLYAQQRGADAGMLPMLWQQPFAGMQMQLGYSPAGLAVHYAAEAEAAVPNSAALPAFQSAAAAAAATAAGGREVSACGQQQLQDGYTVAGHPAVEPEEAAEPASLKSSEALQAAQAAQGLQYNSQQLQQEQQRQQQEQQQQQQQQNGYEEAYGGNVGPEQQQHQQRAEPPPQLPAAVGEVLAVVPQEVQQQLLAAAAATTTGDSSADAAAQGLLLWWHTVAGGYGTNPAVAGPAAEEALYGEAPVEHQQTVVGQSPKRQRTI